MSLVTWLGSGSGAGSGSKPIQRSLSPLLKRRTHERVVLGVLGTRSGTRIEDLDTQIMGPAIEAWGTPDEIIIPAEGESSAAVQSWASFRNIPCRLVASDWATHGKKAGLLRDARIQRESSHLVLLQGPRSNALTALARRLDRKGRHVAISERPGSRLVSSVDCEGAAPTKSKSSA